ncbi:MAG: FkbM family methyltransferase [Polyangiaceae bacterium]
MLDVGSNVGQTAVVVLALTGVETIGLIDASPDALARAATSLTHSQLIQRARFFYGFASAEDAQEVAFFNDGFGAAGSKYSQHSSSSLVEHRVPSARVDTICDQLGMSPDFIKIDVEGAEAEVLQGIERVAEGGPRILVEMHSNPELTMERNVELILEQCARLNYAAWYLAKGERLTGPAPVAHRGRCHLLLQPASEPYPEWLQGVAQGSALEPVLRQFAR